MNKNSNWLIFTYVAVGVVIIFSLAYSFNFSLDSFSKNKTSTSTSDVKSPNTHELSLGQSKTVRGIVYTFSNVISDNRCPADQNCTTNGYAEVELQVGGLGSAESVRVNTNSDTTYANLNLSIESLTPIPAKDAKNVKLLLNIVEEN